VEDISATPGSIIVYRALDHITKNGNYFAASFSPFVHSRLKNPRCVFLVSCIRFLRQVIRAAPIGTLSFCI